MTTKAGVYIGTVKLTQGSSGMTKKRDKANFNTKTARFSRGISKTGNPMGLER